MCDLNKKVGRKSSDHDPIKHEAFSFYKTSLQTVYFFNKSLISDNNSS